MTTRTCECGCGESTTKRFVKGHGWAMRKRLLSQIAQGNVQAYREAAQRGWIPVRKFGIEIECLVPRTVGEQAWDVQKRVAQRITEAGIECKAEFYGHQTPSTWKVVTDSSVQGTGSRSGEPDPQRQGRLRADP